MVCVLKKGGFNEGFDFDKIVNAVNKSAGRIGKTLSNDKIEKLREEVIPLIHGDTVSVDRIHQVVEMALSRVDMDIANSYSGYRNWVKEKAMLMSEVEDDITKSFTEKDRSNSNGNSDLFAFKGAEASNIVLSKMYDNHFLMKDELQAFRDGFIYPHDRSKRLIGTHNCCVVKLENIMDGGFNINGFFCKEPKNITNAVGVVGDIIVSCASAQYGGFSVAEIDTTLSKYCDKSYDYWYDVFSDAYQKEDDVINRTIKEVKKELKDALQGLEFQLNTRESSRGDYPFITFSFGKDTSYWGRQVAKTILEVRREGHGDKVKQKVVFPKLVYIVRRDNLNEDIFKEAVKTGMCAIYPDYIPPEVATPMGCRAFLDDCILEDGTNVLWGRGNIGVITLDLPMIFQNAKVEGLDF